MEPPPPPPPSIATTNFFNLLSEEILCLILDHVANDPFSRKSFSQVSKSFYSLESAHRRALKPRRLEYLPNAFRRYTSISHLDFSLCPRVEDDTLASISRTWKSSLRSINLSASKFFTRKGLSTLASNCSCLIEIDLSNRTDLTDSGLRAIGEAKNLETLRLTRCKSITDMGIACVAVSCTKLRSICLRWCLHVSDFGVGLIALKCKEMRNLDLSYLPITEKCLPPIFQLEHLEDLVLENCLGIDDDGLASLKKCCKSLKMLNLSNCLNISHIGLSSLTKNAQNLEKIILSYGLSLTNDLANCLHNFPRLQSVYLDGCLIRGSGVKAVGNWNSSLKELSLSKCKLVTDECLSFTVQTHKELRKLDITCCHNITYASMYSITSSCPMLTSLRMESCTLVTTDAFLLIGRCQFLEEIDVTDTEIDDAGLESITRCSKLSSLKLGICLKITDKGLGYIGSSCSKLTELDLYRCSSVTDVGIAAIADGCPSLVVINIAYNTNVTDNSLLSLSKCLKLRKLEIRGCPRVSLVGLSAIAVRCRQLTLLDIKKCSNITDDGMIQLAQNSQNLTQANMGLMALASMSCLHHISVYHLEGLTSSGLAAFLLASQTLTKVKLSSTWKSLLPQYIHEYMEARGCVLVWRDKPFWPSILL
ncbi:F-box/LRR-repeat protein 3-like isoform X1 [Senna tora]|uniref:F-box/LRR-repeat protein 3-like isoform X1 n=1 Tax=Senna tora TaxID=362788 RepID=A0A834T6Z4_9FABA|nr:F-box/LRR-repeat protein 3-like isoform X1 [Senna tora]